MLLTLLAPLIPKLRGHFAEFLNESYLNALEFSSHPPVSVYGTITFSLASGFSSQCRIIVTYLSFSIDTHITSQDNATADLPTITPSNASTGKPFSSYDYLTASPLHSNAKSGAGIFNLLSIAYSFRPRLRYRLTLRG